LFVRRLDSVSKVAPMAVTHAHLISYDTERDIFPLVLANCQYTFEMGKGTKIEYDFVDLERQLIDRFLFSKSRISVGNALEVIKCVCLLSTLWTWFWKSPETLITDTKYEYILQVGSYHIYLIFAKTTQNIIIVILFLL